jgi:hypothetical protein
VVVVVVEEGRSGGNIGRGRGVEEGRSGGKIGKGKERKKGKG